MPDLDSSSELGIPPYLVQAAYPTEGSGGWKTILAFDDRETAEQLRDQLDGTHITGDKTEAPGIARVVTIFDLILEGETATYGGLRFLLTSDHESLIRIGGNLDLTLAFFDSDIERAKEPPS